MNLPIESKPRLKTTDDQKTGGKYSGLTILIPAYNEEKGIRDVLDQVAKILSDDVSLPGEILVVDDGSEDATAEVVKTHGLARLVRHRGNRGYGAALKTGIRQASYDLVCITDADGTYPVARIPELVNNLIAGKKDMVVGARTGAEVNIPLIRKPAKWAINRLANLVIGEAIPDLNSGLRLFKRNTALRFFSLLPDGFSFTTTITLAMLTNGYTVEYLPVEYYRRVGKSKIRPIRDTLNFIQLILRIALYFAPLKIFLPLSGMIMLLAVFWGVYSLMFLDRLADSSMIIIAMTAVQVAVVGLLAELINRRIPNVFKAEDGDGPE